MPYETEDEEERGFMQRHRGLVMLVAFIVLGGGIAYGIKVISGGHSSSSHSEDISISLPPMPPPPPPKATPTPPPEKQDTPPPQQVPDKMMEQVPVQNEQKQDAPKDKAPDAPAPLSTGITGPGGGPDLGLGSGGNGLGGGNGTGGAGGSKYGFYASGVQSRVRDALSTNPRTRSAQMTVTIRLWADSTGRVTRAKVSGGGDPGLAASIQNDILTGMQLPAAPPADMPMPIVIRVSAQRP